MRVVDSEYKLAKYVKIAMLFLEDDDAVSAETYIKKASALLAQCKVGAPPPVGCSACRQHRRWGRARLLCPKCWRPGLRAAHPNDINGCRTAVAVPYK